MHGQSAQNAEAMPLDPDGLRFGAAVGVRHGQSCGLEDLDLELGQWLGLGLELGLELGRVGKSWSYGWCLRDLGLGKFVES